MFNSHTSHASCLSFRPKLYLLANDVFWRLFYGVINGCHGKHSIQFPVMTFFFQCVNLTSSFTNYYSGRSINLVQVLDQQNSISCAVPYYPAGYYYTVGLHSHYLPILFPCAPTATLLAVFIIFLPTNVSLFSAVCVSSQSPLCVLS